MTPGRTLSAPGFDQDQNVPPSRVRPPREAQLLAWGAAGLLPVALLPKGLLGAARGEGPAGSSSAPCGDRGLPAGDALARWAALLGAVSGQGPGTWLRCEGSPGSPSCRPGCTFWMSGCLQNPSRTRTVPRPPRRSAPPSQWRAV